MARRVRNARPCDRHPLSGSRSLNRERGKRCRHPPLPSSAKWRTKGRRTVPGIAAPSPAQRGRAGEGASKGYGAESCGGGIEGRRRGLAEALAGPSAIRPYRFAAFPTLRPSSRRRPGSMTTGAAGFAPSARPRPAAVFLDPGLRRGDGLRLADAGARVMTATLRRLPPHSAVASSPGRHPGEGRDP